MNKAEKKNTSTLDFGNERDGLLKASLSKNKAAPLSSKITSTPQNKLDLPISTSHVDYQKSFNTFSILLLLGLGGIAVVSLLTVSAASFVMAPFVSIFMFMGSGMMMLHGARYWMLKKVKFFDFWYREI